jgi:polar amino acid transport system substrate-binding protein
LKINQDDDYSIYGQQVNIQDLEVKYAGTPYIDCYDMDSGNYLVKAPMSCGDEDVNGGDEGDSGIDEGDDIDLSDEDEVMKAVRDYMNSNGYTQTYLSRDHQGDAINVNKAIVDSEGSYVNFYIDLLWDDGEAEYTGYTLQIDIYDSNGNNISFHTRDLSFESDGGWSLTPASDVSAVFVESAWDPIIPNLNAGGMCDAIIAAMPKTDARDQVVDFTRAYYTISQGVIGGSGVAAISDVNDLNAAGTTIGVQSGTASDLYANDNLSAATIHSYEDFPSVIAYLNYGDVDYAMGDAAVLSLEGDLMVTFSEENFGIAVREDSSELLAALDVAIKALIESGEYEHIYKTWFDGALVLADDTTADTATAYPTPTEGSVLTTVLESGDLRLCTDPFYPPFESYDDDGNVKGFDVDIANALVDEIAEHYMGTDNPMFEAPELTSTIEPIDDFS